MNLEYANAIRADVNRVLDIAQKHKQEIDGAINWADLKCAEVEYVESSLGYTWWRAIIDEASPEGNNELHKFILSNMTIKDENLVIIFEW